MTTAQDAQRTMLSKLEGAHRFAKECADDGPEYGDDESASAFAIALATVRDTPPLAGESSEAYCNRVAERAGEALAA